MTCSYTIYGSEIFIRVHQLVFIGHEFITCCRFVQFSDFFSCSWLPCRFTGIFGGHPSVTNSPVKGSSIIALTNLPSKLSTTEKQWAIYHASSRR